MEQEPHINKRKPTFADKIEQAVRYIESLPPKVGSNLYLGSFDSQTRSVLMNLKAGEVLRQLRLLEKNGLEIGAALRAKAAVLVALASYFEALHDDRWGPQTQYNDPEFFYEVQRRFEILSDTIFAFASIRHGTTEPYK